MLGLLRTLDNVLALQRNLEGAMNANYFGHNTSSYGVYPPINMFQDGEDLVVTAELPGVKKENLKLEIKANQLRVAGERTIEAEKDYSVHRQERPSMKYDRTVRLPFRVDADQVKADYVNGILSIRLPRMEADKPKQISIN